MKKIFLTGGIIFFVLVCAVVAVFYLKSNDAPSVFLDGKEVSVSASKTDKDETYVPADEIFDAAGIEYESKDGKLSAHGEKLLEIDTASGEVKIGGEIYSSDFSVEDDKVMIPAYLAGEIMGSQVVNRDNEVHFMSSVPVMVKFRENGREIEFDYSDSLFTSSSKEYNHALAKISIGAAVSAFSAKEADKHWGDLGNFGREANIVNFFQDIGFSNIKCYNYDKSLNDTSNSVAFAIAEKTVTSGQDTHRLIAVSIRGGAYGNEWVSNFDLGNTEVHKGFLLSADGVSKALYEYMGDDTKNTKLWITGYSRGGAVANITAAKIGDEGKVKGENIYAYTFASPRGTSAKSSASEKYGYIFNIISENDIVPLAVPAQWGYSRYGKDVLFPSLLEYDENTALAESKRISDLYSSISDAGKFSLIEIEKANQRHQIQSTIESICTAMKSRIKYTDVYDDILMDFIECSNTKIKSQNGNWKWASPEEGLVNKFGDSALSLLEKAKENEFLKNVESILGETGKQLLCFGAICLKHDLNPYNVIVEEIGIGNLATIASVFSPSGGDAATISKAHYPEAYIAQMLAVVNPTLMRVNQ